MNISYTDTTTLHVSIYMNRLFNLKKLVFIFLFILKAIYFLIIYLNCN